MKAISLLQPLYEYIVQNFAPEERALLKRMQRRAQEAGLPDIMISEEQARLVSILVRMHGRVRRALDVGTLFGYSAAILAQAMGKDGKVVSLELDPRHAKVARENLSELGLAQRVEVREGPALDHMRMMKDESLDLVFVDADKDNYRNYLEESVRLLRAGGILMFDNTFAFGRVLEARAEGEVRVIQEFNRSFAAHRGLRSVLVPVGDGLGVAIKEASATTR